MRKVILMLLAMLLIGCGQNATEANIEKDWTATSGDSQVDINGNVQVITEILNVRNDPDVTSEQLTQVYLGSVYPMIGDLIVSEDLWYQIEYKEGLYGWISGEFCQKTDLEPFEYDQGECPILVLPTHTYLNYQLDVGAVLDDAGFDLYVDGVKTEDVYIFTERGQHQVYGINRKEPDQYTVIYTLEVVNNYTYGLIHEEHDLNSRVIGAVSRKTDIDGEVLAAYMTLEEDLEIWYTLKDQEGYLNVTGKDPVRGISQVHCILENGSTSFEGEDLNPSSRLFNDQYYEIEGDGLVLINPENGVKFPIEDRYHVLDEGSSMIVYNDFSAYSYDYGYSINGTFQEEIYGFKIVDLEKGNFDVLIDFEKSCLFAEETYLDTYDPDDDYFIFNRISDQDWIYADDHYMKEVYVLSQASGQWTMTLVDSPMLDYKDESFELYGTFLDRSSGMGTYKVSDCESLDFMKVYDIIDGHYVLWFEVTLKDGTKGFAYRNRRKTEEKYMRDNVEVQLVLNDGTFHKLEVLRGDMAMGIRTLRTGLEPIDTYIVTFSYEGSANTLIDKNPDKEPVHMWDTDFYNTPNKRWLVSREYYYGDAYGNRLAIYDLSSGSMEMVFSMEEVDLWFRSINVVDDETITFFITDYGLKRPVILKLMDDKWQITNDSKFE